MSQFDGVLLASGGMDSTVLAYDLEAKNKNIILLFLDYGQHCRDHELNTLRKVAPSSFLKNIMVMNISDIYRESQSRMIVEADLWKERISADDLYLPYRNLLFLSIASAFAQSKGIKDVYAAFINSNHAKEIDCSLEFFTKLETLLEEFGSIKINMPFRDFSKAEVAKLGLKVKAPIAVTYSCQVNSKNPCGACPNCVDRIEALNTFFRDNEYGQSAKSP